MNLELFDYKNDTEENKKIYAKLILMTVAFVVFVLLLVPTFGKQKNSVLNIASKPEDPFANLELLAKAAYVFDLKTNRELYAREKDLQLPLASLTKVMTSLTALELIPQSTVLSISREALAQEGDGGLFVGEKWRLADLIGLTLVESANDGANAIASVAGSIDSGQAKDREASRQDFIKKMNQRAKDIGLMQTYFVNETGLDVNLDISGGYGSAEDVAKMLSLAIMKYPDIFEATRYDTVTVSSLDREHKVKNTNSAISKIPNLIAGKTGFTDLSGGNLAIAFDAGFDYPIIAVVLGSSPEGRFDDITKLVWASLEAVKNSN